MIYFYISKLVEHSGYSVNTDREVGEGTMPLDALLDFHPYMNLLFGDQHSGGSLPVSGAAPEPEGPGEVRERFDTLNRPRPWDLPAQVARLLGKLDLKAGAVVVVVAEVLNAVAGDSIAGAIGVPYPGGVVTFALPALAGFFHRKDKGKASGGAAGNLSEARTPHEMVAAVSDSRRSHWQKGLDRIRNSMSW